MEPITIHGQTHQVKHPHPLVISGILGAWAEAADRPALECAYLGYALAGPAKPPHRRQGESYMLYGQRVYDHMRAFGLDHYEILGYADRALAEGIQLLPVPPTPEEVAQAGEASTSGGSGGG